MKKSRRSFLIKSSQYAAGLSLLGIYPTISGCGGGTEPAEDSDESTTAEEETPAELFFQISLAQWSLHLTLFDGKMDNLDFAAKTKNDFGINAVEYVNQFFMDKAEDTAYLADMKQRAADNGVKSLLIMIDGEGNLGDLDDKKRTKAVENHYKWVDAAKFLGCHSIRVNARGEGSMEDVAKAATDGLGRLSEYGAKAEINVIVENHGGYSSNGIWMHDVIKNVGMDNCGTLPDFGNFCVKYSEAAENGQRSCEEEYDRYKGVTELMPFAKAVSAKSHDFDENGDETHTDYVKMMKVVKDAGYKGFVGIEYEGSQLSEEEGIRATKKLLEKVGKALG